MGGGTFARVSNKDLPENRWDGPDQPFTEKELSTQVFAKPVMDSRTLELWFPYPDEEELYETQPSRYLGHLLGHEGPGSILAFLKEKGWANGLSCGSYPICPGTAFFDFEIRLTPAGLKHYQDILKVIFQYISLMKQQPPEEWIFDEMKTIGDVNFRFKQKSPPSRFTSNVSAIMQKPLPRNWLLSGSSRVRRFDSEGIARAMQCLRPDNFRLLIVSHEPPVELPERERWYGTEYAVQRLPAEVLSELEEALKNGARDRPAQLHLPHKNEFIPTRLDVEKKEISEPAKAPKLLRKDERMRLWWKKDDRFWVPKANFLVVIRSPMAYATPGSNVKSRMFCELVKDSLSEYVYDAEISGLDYSISCTDRGIDINVAGYSDKLRVLLEKVVRTMVELKIRPERFKIVKERLERAYKNWNYQQPYYQVGSYVSWLTQDRIWMNHQSAAELPNIEVEDVQAFIPQILGHNHLEILAHGNLYKEDALHMADLVESILKPRPLLQSLWHIRRNYVLPAGSNHTYQRKLADPANVNHAIEYSLLIGDRADRSLKTKTQLFAQILHEPTFDQLRTKEQLGYVVFSGARISVASTFFRVLVQSEREPEYLEERIEAHLSGYRADLETMSDSDFEAHRRSVINQKLEKLKNLESETGRLMENIASEYFDFYKAELDVAELKQVNKRDMLEFYHQFINPHSKTRAKLSVHMIAQGKGDGKVAKVPKEQQNDAVSEVLSKLMSSSGVSCDPKSLAVELEKIDVSGGDQDAVISVAQKHANSSSLSSDQFSLIAEKIRQALPPLFMALGIKSVAVKQGAQQTQNAEGEEGGGKTQTAVNGAVDGNGKSVVMIKDVEAWKAGLRLSEGPRPVMDLSEFDEIEAKL